jgi:uncharacterized protein YlzI (FlbEa/FlbD family)
MSAWLKITRPNIEVGANFVLYQSAIVDMEKATAFAIQQAGSVSFMIEGKTYVVQQQFDKEAYQRVLNFAQHQTGQTLP